MSHKPTTTRADRGTTFLGWQHVAPPRNAQDLDHYTTRRSVTPGASTGEAIPATRITEEL